MSVTSVATRIDVGRTVEPLVLEASPSRLDIPLVLLQTPRLLIGRGADCDLQVDLPGVEEHHCVILHRNQRLVVQSNNSRTWVNNFATRDSVLRAGDRLAIGPVEFQVRRPQPTDVIPSQATDSPSALVSTTAGEAEFDEVRAVLERQLEQLQAQIHRQQQVLAEIETRQEPPAVASSGPHLNGPATPHILTRVPHLPQLTASPAPPESTADAELQARLSAELAQRLADVASREAECRRWEERLSDQQQELLADQAEFAQRQAQTADTEQLWYERQAQWEQNQAELAADRKNLDIQWDQLTAAVRRMETDWQYRQEFIQRIEAQAQQFDAREAALVRQSDELISDLSDVEDRAALLRERENELDFAVRQWKQQHADWEEQRREFENTCAAWRELQQTREEDWLVRESELLQEESLRERRLAENQRTLQSLETRAEELESARSQLSDCWELLRQAERDLAGQQAEFHHQQTEFEQIRRHNQSETAEIAAHQARLADWEQALDSRQTELTERETRLAEQLQALREQDRQLTERHRQLDELGQQMAERAQAVIAQEEAASQRDLQLNERDRRLTELDQHLAGRVQSLTDLAQATKQLELQLAERDQQLADLDQQLAGRSQALAEQEQAAQQRDLQLAERDQQLADLDQQLAERSHTLAEQELVAKQRDVRLAERDQQLADLDQQLAERSQTLTEQEQAVQQRELQLAGRDQQLADLDQQLAERTQALAERTQTLTEQEQAVQERDLRLAERDQQLADLDQQLAERTQTLAEQELVAKQRDLQLAERDQQLVDLDQQLAVRDEALSQRDQAVSNREARLATWDQSLAERAADLEQRDQRLTEIAEQLALRDQTLQQQQRELGDRELWLTEWARELELRSGLLNTREQEQAAGTQNLAHSQAQLNAQLAEISAQQSELAARQDELATAREELAAQRKELEHSREELTRDRMAFSQQQSDLDHAARDLQQKAGAAIARSAALDQRELNLESQSERLRIQEQQLAAAYLQHEQTYAKLQSEREALSQSRSDLQHAGEAITTDRQELDALHEEIRIGQHRLAADRQTLHEAQARLAADQQTLQHARTEWNDTRQRILADQAREQQTVETLAEKSVLVAQQTAENERLARELQTREQQLVERGDQLQKLRNELELERNEWAAQRGHWLAERDALARDRREFEAACQSFQGQQQEIQQATLGLTEVEFDIAEWELELAEREQALIAAETELAWQLRDTAPAAFAAVADEAPEAEHPGMTAWRDRHDAVACEWDLLQLELAEKETQIASLQEQVDLESPVSLLAAHLTQACDELEHLETEVRGKQQELEQLRLLAANEAAALESEIWMLKNQQARLNEAGQAAHDEQRAIWQSLRDQLDKETAELQRELEEVQTQQAQLRQLVREQVASTIYATDAAQQPAGTGLQVDQSQICWDSIAVLHGEFLELLLEENENLQRRWANVTRREAALACRPGDELQVIDNIETADDQWPSAASVVAESRYDLLAAEQATDEPEAADVDDDAEETSPFSEAWQAELRSWLKHEPDEATQAESATSSPAAPDYDYQEPDRSEPDRIVQEMVERFGDETEAEEILDDALEVVEEEPLDPQLALRSRLAEMFDMTDITDAPSDDANAEAEAQSDAEAEAIDSWDDYATDFRRRDYEAETRAVPQPDDPEDYAETSEDSGEEEDSEPHDESIEAYMNRLLARNRRSDGELFDTPFQPQQYASPEPAPVEPAESEPEPSAEIAEPVAPPRPRPNVEAMRAGLDSMREVANLSTRATLKRYNWKRLRTKIAIELVLAACSLLIGSAILIGDLWGMNLNPLMGWMAICLTVFLISEMFKNYSLIHQHEPRQFHRPAESSPAVEESLEPSSDHGDEPVMAKPGENSNESEVIEDAVDPDDNQED